MQNHQPLPLAERCLTTRYLVAVQSGPLLDVVLTKPGHYTSTKPRLIQVDELALWLILAQASEASGADGTPGLQHISSFSEDAC